MTIPLYESPQGQSPAAMRYLMQMDFDDKCFAAAVLSLAVKGHLRIAQSDGALGFSKVFNLRGGLSAWRSENLPVVRQAGQSSGGQSSGGKSAAQ